MMVYYTCMRCGHQFGQVERGRLPGNECPAAACPNCGQPQATPTPRFPFAPRPAR